YIMAFAKYCTWLKLVFSSVLLFITNMWIVFAFSKCYQEYKQYIKQCSGMGGQLRGDKSLRTRPVK
uniref:Uncharacterized protein n=1 Tax=Lepisosteus oculatus TaxID=7918 RepID=W5N0Q9_LEPOC